MSQPAKVTIDIWSDIMCPWCVIGVHQLDAALDGLAGEIEASVRFHPFELNPDMPPEGEDQRAHIMRKYGRTAEQAADASERMRGAADNAGYSFGYAGEGEAPSARMWNTRAAHRLLAHALRDYSPQMQVRLKHLMFDAHFQQRRTMSDHAVLAELAAQAGMESEAAKTALTDSELNAIVEAGEQQAWDWNISGVPAMVVNGKFMIPGAQDPQTYASVLRKVVEREAALAAAQ
jgi:predicted DsbA family dithiol-disulfide isomerase